MGDRPRKSSSRRTISPWARLLHELGASLTDEQTKSAIHLCKYVKEEFLSSECTHFEDLLSLLEDKSIISPNDIGFLEDLLKTIPAYDCVEVLEEYWNNERTKGTREFAKSYSSFGASRFVGRNKDKRDILTFFQGANHDKPPCLFIHGFPGIGKTRLTYKVCAEFENGPEVAFLNIREITDKTSIIKKVVTAIEANPMIISDPDEDLSKIIKQLKTEHVIVFDNADEILDVGTGMQKVDDFFKCLHLMVANGNPEKLFIIVTSRFPIPKLTKIEWQSKIKFQEKLIDKMSPEDASKLIKTNYGRAEVTTEEIQDIAKLCGFCPLPMKVIACRLKDKTLSAADMIKFLRPKKKKKQQMKTMGSFHSPELDYYENMDHCLQNAFNKLKLDEKKMLMMLSIIPGSFDTKAAACITGVDADTIPLLLQILSYYSFVEKSVVNKETEACTGSEKVRRYQLHTLIRRFLGELDGNEDQKKIFRYAEERFVKYYSKKMKSIAAELETGYKNAMRDQQNEEANLFHLFALENEVPQTLISLEDPATSQEVIYLLELMRNIPERLRYFLDKQKKAQKDGDMRLLAELKCWEALQHQDMGAHIDVCKEVLEDAFQTLNNLPEMDLQSREVQLTFALFYHVWGNVLVGHYRCADGIAMLKKSLALRKQVLPRKYHKKTVMIRTLNDLGRGFFNAAQNSNSMNDSAIKESIRYHTEALEIRESVHSHHCDTVILYMNLGACYHHMGNYDLAIEFYEKGLELNEEVHLCTMAQEASLKKNMATSLYELNKFDDAFFLAKEALDIKSYKGDHPEVARCLYLCGLLKYELEKLTEAEDYFEKQLRVEEKLMSKGKPHSPDFKDLEKQLKKVCKLLDKDFSVYAERFKTAEGKFEKAVDDRRRGNRPTKHRRNSEDSSSSGASVSPSKRYKSSYSRQHVNPAIFENRYMKMLDEKEVFTLGKRRLEDCLASDIPGVGENPRLEVYTRPLGGMTDSLPTTSRTRSPVDMARSVQNRMNTPHGKLGFMIHKLCDIM